MFDTRLVLVTLAVALVSSLAHADVAPDPGRTRVNYRFEIDGVPAGMAAIGFPGYNPGADNHVITLEAGKSVGSFQGYTPGLYLLSKTDAAAMPAGDDDARKAYLASKARQCLSKIPRVFEVDTSVGITKMTDVIHLEATGAGCEASLVRTTYEGPSGRGEGTVDAAGNRTPPPPFGRDLPNITESGFKGSTTTTTTTTTPTLPTLPQPAVAPAPAPTPAPANPVAPPATSAGCNMQGDAAPATLGLLALTFIATRRRRRT